MLNSPRLQVVYFMAPLLFAVIKPTITTTITVSQPLHRSACVSPHFQLRTGGVCWCKLLMATSTFGLGRRRWPSPQQCYLHCLRTVCLRTPVTKRINNLQSTQNFSNKKLSYRRGTARCIVSIKILPIATQQCRNYLYDKS